MKLIDRILQVIYPPRCPLCGGLFGSDQPCETCSDDIENQRISGKVCRYCGLEKVHCQCKSYHYLFEGIASPFYNRDTAQNGVYRLKFRNSPYSADYFAHEMVETFNARFSDIRFDRVCIVPTKSSDAKERYYDQVALLAKRCAKELDVPLKVKTLKKVRKTERQHKLSHDKRQANVKGAFKAPKRLDGEIVLLIDDIKTTGYTLNECAKQLRLAGADKVYCLTALITLNSSCKTEKVEI